MNKDITEQIVSLIDSVYLSGFKDGLERGRYEEMTQEDVEPINNQLALPITEVGPLIKNGHQLLAMPEGCGECEACLTNKCMTWPRYVCIKDKG